VEFHFGKETTAKVMVLLTRWTEATFILAKTERAFGDSLKALRENGLIGSLK